MKLLRIVPDKTNISFMRLRRLSFPFSAFLSLAAIVLFFTVGLNFGIDFKGGTLIEIRSKSGPADLASIRATLNSLGLGDVQLQEFGSPTDVLIRIEQQPGGEEAQQGVITKVRTALGDGYDYRRTEIVGPAVSRELVRNGVIGILIAIVGIFVYLWFRFDWQFAVGAAITTVHDVVLTIGFYSLTQIDFDLTSVAAILTILGYSVNDTVVIYDRIREMLRRYKQMPIAGLLDIAMNATLSRTVITSATTLLATLGLFFFGPEVIQSFITAMLFGIICGVYSTAFIAAPLLIYFGVRTQGSTEVEAPPASAAPAKAVPAR